MRVKVRLFSRFRELLPPEARGEAVVELPDGADLNQLLAHLGISGRVRLITINGLRENDRSHVLCEGDSVRVFPVMVGG